MAYVPGCLHDVFVSYACADDAPAGLVRDFCGRLGAALATQGLRLESTASPDGVDIFLDRRTIQAGEDLTEQILTAARSSAVFVAFHSLAYLESAWCRREAEEFCGNYDTRRPQLQKRLFVIALGERGTPESSAIKALRSRLFRRFYYHHPKDGPDFPFDPREPARENAQEFTLAQETDLLARQIAATLEEMRKESPRPSVFLADTAAAAADDIKRWLVQQQVLVLRASGSTGDWRAESRALLARANIFVDLHEAQPSEVAREQASLAAELRKPHLRWVPRGTPSSDSSTERDAGLEPIEETLEDFKKTLLARLTQPSTRHRAPERADPRVAGDSLANALVLLVGANRDEGRVAEIERKLDEIGCGRDAFLSDDAATEGDAWRQEMQNLLKLHDPAGVVFVDGDCSGNWADRRLRDLVLLLRDVPAARPALCVYPPPDKPRRYRPPAAQVRRVDPARLDQLRELLP